MRLFASIVAVAVVASLPALAREVGISGKWSGEMRQVDPDAESKYPMTLTLKGADGMTSYPTMKCSGALTRIAETKSGYAIYQEKIANEPGGTCIAGLVTVHVEGDKVVLGWFAAFEGTPSLASAVLAQEAK